MKKRIKRKLKRLMEENVFGVVICLLIGLIIMLIYSGERNTRESSHISRCKCEDWLFDGENGNKTGAFFKCSKCGKTKYIPYKDLMGMPEDEFNYWSNRPPTNEEKYRQDYYQHKFEYEK